MPVVAAVHAAPAVYPDLVQVSARRHHTHLFASLQQRLASLSQAVPHGAAAAAAAAVALLRLTAAACMMLQPCLQLWWAENMAQLESHCQVLELLYSGQSTHVCG